MFSDDLQKIVTQVKSAGSKGELDMNVKNKNKNNAPLKTFRRVET